MKVSEKNVSVVYAAAIKEFRLLLEETQKSMAERLGISERGYQYWETGERIPGGKWLAKLHDLALEEGVERLSTAALFRDYSIIPGGGSSPNLKEQEVLEVRRMFETVLKSGRKDLIEKAKKALADIIGSSEEMLDITPRVTDTQRTITMEVPERDEVVTATRGRKKLRGRNDPR